MYMPVCLSSTGTGTKNTKGAHLLLHGVARDRGNGRRAQLEEGVPVVGLDRGVRIGRHERRLEGSERGKGGGVEVVEVVARLVSHHRVVRGLARAVHLLHAGLRD